MTELTEGRATVGGVPVRWVVAPGPPPGGADDHVPMEAAYRFAAALADRSPAAGKNVSVRVTEGLAHGDAVRNPDAVDRCLAWLAAS